MTKRKRAPAKKQQPSSAPTRKSPQGEMQNVRGTEGATLTIIPPEPPEGGELPPKNRPRLGRPQRRALAPPSAPAPAPVSRAPAKPVRLHIQAEFGSFFEQAETWEQAKARAEEIVAKGGWQDTGNQKVLHGPSVIRRVTVTQ